MSVVLPYLLSGISVGGQYALIAIGYTMVYGILRLINFAHGDVFMVAGVMMVYLSASLPLYISMPLMLILTVIIGFAIERAAYKPLRSAPRMSIMISAIGVSYLLQNLAAYITGGLAQQYPTIPFISDSVNIGPATTKVVTLVTPFLVIALVFALVMLINHTKIGMAMRAVSKDYDTAQLMGIRINCGHQRHLRHRLVPGGHRLCAVLHQLYCRYLYLRRNARPEGLCCCGVRRHWFHSRRCDRRIHHRHLREHRQGPGGHAGRGWNQHQPGLGCIFRCCDLCSADYHPRGKAHRPVR